MRNLSPQQRLSIIQALIFSRLYYNTETWGPLQPRHVASTTRILHDGYARALGVTHLHRTTHHIHHDQLRAALSPSVPTFQSAIRAKRLRYLHRMATAAPAPY